MSSSSAEERASSALDEAPLSDEGVAQAVLPSEDGAQEDGAQEDGVVPLHVDGPGGTGGSGGVGVEAAVPDGAAAGCGGGEGLSLAVGCGLLALGVRRYRWGPQPSQA